MLLYSPRWLFLIPGLILSAVGAFASAAIAMWGFRIGSAQLDVGTLAVTCMAVLVGFQLLSFGLYAKVYAISENLIPHDPRLAKLCQIVTLELGITVSLVVLGAGVALMIYALLVWWEAGFGPLPWHENLRRVIPAATLTLLGVQVLFSSFFLSVLGMKASRRER